MPRRTTLAALTLAAALTLPLAACGSGDDDGRAITDSAPATTTARAPVTTATTTTGGTTSTPSADACRFLPTGPVAKALGGTPKVTGGSTGCSFRASDDGPAVLLTVIPIQIDPKTYGDQAKQSCKTPVLDVDAGDDAWVCRTINVQGVVIQGSTLVQVDVTDVPSDAKGIEIAKRLVPEMRTG